jgi:endoglucanase
VGLSYNVAGMDQLIAAVRGAEGSGWHHPVFAGVLGGSLNFPTWLSYVPTDSAAQLGAVFDNFNFSGSDCSMSDNTCMSNTYGVVAQRFPVYTGGFGDNSWSSGINNFLTFMQNNTNGHLIWSWDVQMDQYSVISTYSGTPTAYGQGYENRLLTLP